MHLYTKGASLHPHICAPSEWKPAVPVIFAPVRVYICTFRVIFAPSGCQNCFFDCQYYYLGFHWRSQDLILGRAVICEGAKRLIPSERSERGGCVGGGCPPTTVGRFYVVENSCMKTALCTNPIIFPLLKISFTPIMGEHGPLCILYR